MQEKESIMVVQCEFKNSCINIYTHSCLKPLSNPLKDFFKQLKPCLTHGIHVLFEHTFYLKILKTGHRLFTWHQTTMQGCPGISILSWFLLTSTSLQKGIFGCVQCCQSGFFMIFQVSSMGFSWNQIKCKNNDQTCLFQCINICWVPRKMFEHSACGFVFKQLPRIFCHSG